MSLPHNLTSQVLSDPSRWNLSTRMNPQGLRPQSVCNQLPLHNPMFLMQGGGRLERY